MGQLYSGAVFFDYDGTLVDESAHISTPTPKTMEALRKLRDNNYMVGLATGRPKCGLPISFFDFDCYVLSNGAYTILNNKEILNIPIDVSELTQILDYLNSGNFNFILENQKECYCKDMSEDGYKNMVKSIRFPTEWIYPMKDADLKGIYKLMVSFDDKKRFDTFVKKFEEKFEIYIHRFHPSCDITKKGMTKAIGVKAAIDYLHLATKNTYAFGDAFNDREMLELVGTGVVMGIHSPLLENSASFVTGSVSDDGVYEGLKKLHLVE